MGRSRPLVKFQSGTVEAELVKTWGAERTLETALAFLPAAGWTVRFQTPGILNVDGASIMGPSGYVGVNLKRIYTPPAEIPRALHQALTDKMTEYRTPHQSTTSCGPGVCRNG